MNKNSQLLKTAMLALVLVFSYTVSSAQTMMPIPNHSSVYSGSARGYWFTAPVDFTITGLRVPSQAGTGGQYIHVMKLNTTPPIAFTAQSSNFTTLTYISNATNGVIQTVNIQVTAGDVIGIMGTAGTSNSYATGAYNSNIAGQAVSLSRLGYQGHITGAGGAPMYWGVAAGAGGSISRVEMYYTTGPPCGGVTNLNINNLNSVGASFSWTAPANTQGYEYQVVTTAGAPTTGIVATNTTSGSVIGLSPSTPYYLLVRNQCTNNSWSKWDSLAFTTLDPCVEPPSFSTTYVDSNSATVVWGGVTTASTFQFILDSTKITPTGANATSTTSGTRSFTGLTEGTTYYIYIRSLCSGNDSSDWYLDSFYVPIPCRAPEIKITNISTNQGVASWAPVRTALSYEYAIDNNPFPPPVGTPIYSNSYLLPYLNDGVAYYIHVRTICEDRGVGSNSKWASAGFETTALGVRAIGSSDNIMSIYPNPATSILHVDVNTTIGKDASIQLLDITGKVLQVQRVTTRKVSFNVASIPSGVYTLKYSDAQHTQVIKFTKE